nr:unnamed protein product [Digitaria exilis]
MDAASAAVVDAAAEIERRKKEKREKIICGLVDKRRELLAISVSLTRAATCDPPRGSRSDVSASSAKVRLRRRRDVLRWQRFLAWHRRHSPGHQFLLSSLPPLLVPHSRTQLLY